MTTSGLRVEEDREKFEAWFSNNMFIGTRCIANAQTKRRMLKAWTARALMDAPSSDLISTPQEVLDEKFIQHFGLKGAVAEIRNLIDKQGGYDFEALHREQSDGQ